jgi:probable rRNA maturation factor
MATGEGKRKRIRWAPEGPYVPPKGPLIWFRNDAGPGSTYAAKLARKIAREQMKELHLDERELSLSLVSDEEIRRINKEWRNKDKHTDVLTFPLHVNVGSLGDIVVSLPTARRQAKEGGWSLEKELRRLIAHGLMHSLGYDHVTTNDALRMASAERRLLGDDGLVGSAYETVSKPVRAKPKK